MRANPVYVSITDRYRRNGYFFDPMPSLLNILIALGRFNGPLSSLAGKSAIKPKASFSMEPNDDSQLKLQEQRCQSKILKFISLASDKMRLQKYFKKQQ